MRALTDSCAPRPSATTAITAPTPMTTPSIVRNDRSLLARSAPSATPIVSPSSIATSSSAWTPPTAASAAPARCTAGGWSGLLLQSATGAGSHPRLQLVTLRLQNGRAEQRHLLSLLYTAQDLGVVEIADPDADRARRVFVAGLDEHDHASASPAAG